MNKDLFEQSLKSAPDTLVNVSHSLHQRVMRKVRQSKAPEKTSTPVWMLPAWGAGMVATAAVFMLLVQSTELTPENPQGPSVTVFLSQLENKLVALSHKTALPEAELRKELKHLKADLEKFALGS